MSRPDLDRVIDDVLDGVAGPEERAWLERRLASDTAARERYAAREALFRTLDGPPLPEAPADLLPAIVREIGAVESPGGARATRHAGRDAASGWLAALADAFRHRPARAWGYTASMAALALALVFAAMRLPLSHGPRSLPASGTIGAPADEGAPVLAHGVTSTPDARVTSTARAVAGGAVELTLEAEVRAGSWADVVLESGPDVTLSGVAGGGLRFEPATSGPAGRWQARVERTAAGSVLLRPRPGATIVRVLIGLRSPGGAARGALEIPPSPPAR